MLVRTYLPDVVRAQYPGAALEREFNSHVALFHDNGTGTRFVAKGAFRETCGRYSLTRARHELEAFDQVHSAGVAGILPHTTLENSSGACVLRFPYREPITQLTTTEYLAVLDRRLAIVRAVHEVGLVHMDLPSNWLTFTAQGVQAELFDFENCLPRRTKQGGDVHLDLYGLMLSFSELGTHVLPFGSPARHVLHGPLAIPRSTIHLSYGSVTRAIRDARTYFASLDTPAQCS